VDRDFIGGARPGYGCLGDILDPEWRFRIWEKFSWKACVFARRLLDIEERRGDNRGDLAFYSKPFLFAESTSGARKISFGTVGLLIRRV